MLDVSVSQAGRIHTLTRTRSQTAGDRDRDGERAHQFQFLYRIMAIGRTHSNVQFTFATDNNLAYRKTKETNTYTFALTHRQSSSPYTLHSQHWKNYFQTETETENSNRKLIPIAANQNLLLLHFLCSILCFAIQCSSSILSALAGISMINSNFVYYCCCYRSLLRFSLVRWALGIPFISAQIIRLFLNFNFIH